jgi:hypothetical protein
MNYKNFMQKHYQPEKFWKEQANTIEWYKNLKSSYQRMTMDIHYGIRMARLNICYLALDKHIKMAMAIKWRLFMIHQ